MFRSLIPFTRIFQHLPLNRPNLVTNVPTKTLLSLRITRNFSCLQQNTITAPFLDTSMANPAINTLRTVTKFSMRTGKRKAVKAVIHRFYRLHWGGWIRRLAGCHKRLWKKSPNRRRRHRQHVFCNATQSRLLDKMVTNFWRKPKYYVNDPYEPYHTREEFWTTRIKPKPYVPSENL
ncbi:large ribosomal subunit protein bL35m [Euwallacea fornicatus]|uniref:large ribosomal subunit protein bL35m n=1 Tax=Euwallacea fornicatus TaxID=995702 RepID=UPI00338F3F23